MRTALLVVVMLAACGKPKEDAASATGAAPPPPVAKDAGVACPQPGEHVCVGDDVVQCKANRTLGDTLQSCKDGCVLGACKDTCATNDAELIYLVDSENHFLRFDPRKLPGDPFELVGTLTCDAGRATPFSMAVDRRGIAWVEYTSGKIFRVSIIDAHCSKAAAYAPEPGKPWAFGMGFASDGPKATTETLYVAARQDDNPFGRLDVAQDPPRYVPLGTFTSMRGINPELTGTGDGALYGYFPAPGLGFVQEMERASGKAIGPRRSLGGDGAVGAYAFAHWGGVFYVFASNGDTTSDVHAIHRATGKHEVARKAVDVPYQIVGAGVSTCAPLLERAP